LFNAGKYFECHEVLEEIWLNSQGVEREFFHALIQMAREVFLGNSGLTKHWRPIASDHITGSAVITQTTCLAILSLWLVAM
jgi:Domain of unknown function (DUF309)